MLCWCGASLWLTSSLCFCERTWRLSFVAVGLEQLDSDSGSRLMPVGSPLDTHDCDWCVLRCHARGINTTRITAAFTFNDLLCHLPIRAMDYCHKHCLSCPSYTSISNQNTNFLRRWKWLAKEIFSCVYGLHPPDVGLGQLSLGRWVITSAAMSICYLINVESKPGLSSGEGHVAWVLHHNRVDHRPSGRPRQQRCLQQTAGAESFISVEGARPCP